MRWSRAKSLGWAVGIGLVTTALVYALLHWFGIVDTVGAGWPSALAAGVMTGAAVYQMAREELRPLEQNAVARGITAVYRPALGWVLRHKVSFLAIPVSITLLGLLVWLGFGWLATRSAPRSQRPEPTRVRPASGCGWNSGSRGLAASSCPL